MQVEGKVVAGVFIESDPQKHPIISNPLTFLLQKYFIVMLSVFYPDDRIRAR